MRGLMMVPKCRGRINAVLGDKGDLAQAWGAGCPSPTRRYPIYEVVIDVVGGPGGRCWRVCEVSGGVQVYEEDALCALR